MKRIYVFMQLTLAILISGCVDQITGSVTADLDDSSIYSGRNTQLTVNAKNTGNIPFSGYFTISTNKPDIVKIGYPNSEGLKFTLQPGETTGDKILSVSATSETRRTDYDIIVKIVTDGNKVIDMDNVILKVKQN